MMDITNVLGPYKLLSTEEDRYYRQSLVVDGQYSYVEYAPDDHWYLVKGWYCVWQVSKFVWSGRYLDDLGPFPTPMMAMDVLDIVLLDRGCKLIDSEIEFEKYRILI